MINISEENINNNLFTVYFTLYFTLYHFEEFCMNNSLFNLLLIKIYLDLILLHIERNLVLLKVLFKI